MIMMVINTPLSFMPWSTSNWYFNFHVGYWIHILAQKLLTSSNNSSHLLFLKSCVRNFIVSINAMALTIPWSFRCKAFDNSFMIPNTFIIKCKANKNSKLSILLIKLDTISFLFAIVPSWHTICKTSKTNSQIVKKRIKVIKWEPQQVFPDLTKFVSWCLPLH